MNGLENAQHDLNDAQFSLETAIDLLSSIETDACAPELQTVLQQLQSIKVELDSSFRELQNVSSKVEL